MRSRPEYIGLFMVGILQEQSLSSNSTVENKSREKLTLEIRILCIVEAL